jgi:putative oxidoreductase
MRIGLFVVGRIVAGLYYLYSGLMGLVHLPMMSGYAASKGVPAAELAVIVSHLLLIVAGFCFLAGWRPALGVACAVLFFLPVTFSMHAFWGEKDPQMAQNQMIHFTKNIALLASTLMFLGIPRPWPWSLEERMRGRTTVPPAGGRAAPVG